MNRTNILYLIIGVLIVGVAAVAGTPFWPWHAAQTPTRDSMSSAAGAGPAMMARTAAAPKMAEAKLLTMFFHPFAFLAVPD